MGWMRGFISFLLVLAFVFFITVFVSSFYISSSISLSKAMVVERAYQLQMNIKENILEAIRQGAEEGYGIYSATHSKVACIKKLPNCFKDNEAMEAAKSGAMLKLLQLSSITFDSEFEVYLWCGTPPSEAQAHAEAIGLVLNGTLTTNQFSSISTAACTNALTIELSQSTDPLENPRLAVVRIGSSSFTFGFSAYSKKFRAASVSYIPLNQMVKQ